VPELPEVEFARATIERSALRRRIADVDDTDTYECRPHAPGEIREALLGRRLTGAFRRGKTMWVETSGVGRRRTPGPVLGLHLGMSGRVIVDGVEGGDPLIYASNRPVEAWYRFGVHFADGGSFMLRDPRRLGAVELDPDESRLGPDALSLTFVDLDHALDARTAPVKAVLMDQARVAGLGNLLTDEALWRAGIDPARTASTLDADEVTALHRAIRTTLRVLGRRGGSHRGHHLAARFPGGLCPRDGAPLLRRTVGGRTTYSCPLHQH
jgi:formamidopyrimidine-DNA glycosylase